MVKFEPHLHFSKAKMLLASGELRSLTPWPGLCLWTPLWAPPQTSAIDSRSALASITKNCTPMPVIIITLDTLNTRKTHSRLHRPLYQFYSCNRESRLTILTHHPTIEHDLGAVKTNQCATAKYLGQKSSRSKFSGHTDRHRRTGRTECYTWITKVVGHCRVGIHVHG